MRQLCSLAELNENLVPFTAQQVTSSLIWCAENVRNIEALRTSCSYIIDPESLAPAKIFQAERYGGSGIQRNGGGARCGFDGHYQVKGIGSNPLVGEGSDKHHSDGALGAIHAIYEALWGEVLAKILPYSAVRAQAVLLTNIYIDKSFDRSHGNSRRALLVREPVIRPAHFERAPYFRPRPEYAGQFMHDARRVRAVIRMLPASLPAGSEETNVDAQRDPRLYCIEGLCELAHREAWQMAYCRTRFLRLTTSPSNIAVDGRLMDFNGLSCLFPGDYPNDFGHQLRLSELMKEPAVLQQGLIDLCFYLGKYLFDSEFTRVACQKVEMTFKETFHEACYYGYLEQLGIPIDRMPKGKIPDILRQLVDSFIAIVNRRSEKLYSRDSDLKSDSPLQGLVLELIRQSQEQNLVVGNDRNMDLDIQFKETLHCFSQGIHYIKQVRIMERSNSQSLLTQIEQHARKRLQPRKWLGKAYMFDAIADLLDEHGDDPMYLLEAFSDMGTRMQIFSEEALGCFSPVKIAQ
ncbi:MchC protein [Enterobacteriaceae bacterium H18W14]|uniref:MchC protein n=1 Tax=Dryocola boscaweniae TaxID=2925397 RepID=UPI0022F04515|nr:MchC protein [Dryocola boscaweniae]MCT4717357.1 MchC protein [Dryocola boscaweniae]